MQSLGSIILTNCYRIAKQKYSQISISEEKGGKISKRRDWLKKEKNNNRMHPDLRAKRLQSLKVTKTITNQLGENR